MNLRTPRFKTSEKVTIVPSDLGERIKGAIVRSYNVATGEYYVTKRDEKGLQAYHVPENQLMKED